MLKWLEPENKQFVLKFIAEYRKHECLWKWKIAAIVPPNCKKNCDEAYENLRKFCEKTNKPATIEFVRNTIEELRCVFAKEYLKFLKSARNSINDEDIYNPNLYFFDAMHFIVSECLPKGFQWRHVSISDKMKNDFKEEPDWVREDEDQVYNDDDSMDESSQDQEDTNDEESDEYQISDDDGDTMDESTEDQHQQDNIKKGPDCVQEDEDSYEDQTSDDDSTTDESSQDSSDTEPLTPASEHSFGVTTASGLSSDTHKKIYRNEENTDDLLRVRETGEFDGIGSNEDQIIDNRNSMNESILGLPDAAPTTPASEQWVDVAVSSRISSNARTKHKEIDQNRENANGSSNVAHNQLMQEIDEFVSISNNKDQTIENHDFMNETIQDLPDAIPTTPASEQWVDGQTAYRISSDTPTKHKNNVSEKSFDFATSSGTSSNIQKHTKIDQKEENTNGRIRVVPWSQLMQKKDNFASISNDKDGTVDHDFVNESIQDLPNAASTIPANEQWVDDRTACRLPSDTQKKHKNIVSEKSLDVETSSRISSNIQKKCKEIDQNEENTNVLARVARSKWRQKRDVFDSISNNNDQTIDDCDDSIEDLSNAAPASEQLQLQAGYRFINRNVGKLRIVNEQSADVATTSTILSNTQNKRKKTDQNEENTDDLLGVREADEFDSIGNSANQITDESIQDLPDAAPTTPASEQWVDARTTYKLSSETQRKRKNIASEHSSDVPTASRISNTQKKHKKIEQNEENTNNSASFACNLLTLHTDNIGNKITAKARINQIWNNVLQTTDKLIDGCGGFMKDSIQDLPGAAPTTPASEQAIEQSSAISSRISSNTQKKHKKINQNDENTNDPIRVVARNKLVQRTDKFGDIGYNKGRTMDDHDDSIDSDLTDLSGAAYPTPAQQQVDVATASEMSSDTQRKCNKIGRQQSDVQTTRRISSNTQKIHKETDQNEENMDVLFGVNKTNEFDSVGDNEDQIIDCDFMNESIEDLPDEAPSTPASEHWVDFRSTCRISSDTPKKRKNIDSEQSFNDATLSGISNIPRKLRKTDQNEGISNDLARFVAWFRTIDHSVGDISDTAPPTPTSEQSVVAIANRISSNGQKEHKKTASEQLVDVATASKISSSTQKKHKKIDENEENTNDPARVVAWNRTIDHSIGDLSDAAPPTPASEQSVVAIANRISSGAQRKHKKIASEQLVDVVTASRNIQKHKKVDRNVENRNDPAKVTCSKPMQEAGEFGSIGNNEGQIIHNSEKSVEILSDATSPTVAIKQSLVVTTLSGMSSNTQRSKKIAKQESAAVATTSRISSNTQKHKKINDDDCDESSENLSDTVPSTPASEQSDDVATASTSSNTQKKHKKMTFEQFVDVATTSRISSKTHKKCKKIDQNEENMDDLEKVICSKLMQKIDEYDSIGNNVAAKLRAADEDQRVIAEKLISDILYHAQMNTLNPKARLHYVP